MSGDDLLQVVVWELGDSTLAVRVETVLEVAPVRDGEARTRDAQLPLHRLGLDDSRARQAIVVRTDGGLVALPADAVDGVITAGATTMRDAPAWLAAVRPPGLDRLIRLDDGRVAVLLSPEGAVTGGGGCACASG